MNWVDYGIIAIIGVSIVISLWRGFTREALSLAGWVVAVWVGLNFAGRLNYLLSAHIQEPTVRLFVAFAILFFITLLLAALVNYLAVQLIHKTGLSGTDRMIGIFFGLARGAVIVALLVLLAGLTPLPHDPWWHQSSLLPYFQEMAVRVRPHLPSDLAARIHF